MRRSAALLIGMGTLWLVSVTGVAAAYEDTGSDPDDRAVLVHDPDIASTTRRVWTKEAGRFLSVLIRAYEEFGIYWGIEARLDSKGGPRVDYTIRLYNADTGGAGCDLYRRTGFNHVARGHFRQAGDEVRCRIRVRDLHPTKRIRWKLISESGYGGPTEYAPNDRTWYS